MSARADITITIFNRNRFDPVNCVLQDKEIAQFDYDFVGQHRIDRKSTRLNSSHGYISYAVFCLKKKKNTAHKLTSETSYLPRSRSCQSMTSTTYANGRYYVSIASDRLTIGARSALGRRCSPTE